MAMVACKVKDYSTMVQGIDATTSHPSMVYLSDKDYRDDDATQHSFGPRQRWALEP